MTIDLAQRDDGVWRVIELGDAQVSDRPTTISPYDFVAALSADAR
ncbi:ATP-grasp domain-containing protein [Micromonospora sp. DT201]